MSERSRGVERWQEAVERRGVTYHGAVPSPGDLYPPMLAVPMPSPPPQFDFPNPGPLNGEMVYPEHGLPPRRGEARPSLSPWGRLARGQPLGQKTILVYDADDPDVQKGFWSILKIEGDDMDACLVQVTLLPPLVIPVPFSPLLRNSNNLTGEQNNFQNIGNFPGTATPTKWPQFEAVIEWGIGGTSSRMVVDFTNGAKVPNLSASYLRIHARLKPDAEQPGTSAAYVLAAFVGPGPGVSPARHTTPVGTLAADAESGAFPVPAYARNAYVVGAADGAPPPVTVATLRLWQDRGKNVCVGNFVVTGNQPLPFPIPNNAKYASVVNGTGVEVPFSLIYDLW